MRLIPAIAAVAVATANLASQQPKFTARVDLVQLDALVAVGGRPVSGLTADDFELRDNGVVQRIESFRAEDVPLDLVLLMDASASVEGEPLRHLREAAAATLTALRRNDRAGLVGFAGRVAWLAPLTADLGVLRRAAASLDAGGLTSFHDALFSALLVSGASGRRTLLLVHTDGVDTASWLDLDAAARLADRSDAVIYVVTVRVRQNLRRLAPLEESRRLASLADLADRTGGTLLFAERADRVRQTLAHVVDEFRDRYLLTYYPQGVEARGWHRIELRVKRRGASVHTRRGYYVE